MMDSLAPLNGYGWDIFIWEWYAAAKQEGLVVMHMTHDDARRPEHPRHDGDGWTVA